MSLLHPDEDDAAFAAGHAAAGWNKAVNRCMRLRRLLERAKVHVSDARLARDIDAALEKTFYDESEDSPSDWSGKT
jgi:hypothetical protein